MTDGEAPKPVNEIKKFRQNGFLNEKFSFYAVGYGSGCNSAELATIALEMNGKSISAPTAKDLENIFDEIIGNVFGNDGSI